jgi:hypothetical protein
MLQESGLDPAREPILASGYIDQIFNRCGQFFLITRHRVVCRGASGLSQNLIADLTGVERSFGRNISLLSPGSTRLMFHVSLVPPVTLSTKVFQIISRLWMEHREGASKPVSQIEANGKICPFCEEAIKAGARACVFGSRDLRTATS